MQQIYISRDGNWLKLISNSTKRLMP